MALLVEIARPLLFDFKELLEVDYDANAKFLKWKMIKRNNGEETDKAQDNQRNALGIGEQAARFCRALRI